MSKEASAWMPLYVGDYLGDTQRLTTEQHGAYLLLMLDYWRNGPPPDDDDVLQQITKLDKARWKRCRPILARMFKVANGEWRHKRIDHELEQAQDNASRRSEKAKRAAQARWGDRNDDAASNAPSMPQALLDECPPPSPSPLASSDANTDAPDILGFVGEVARVAGVASADPGRAAEQNLIVRAWVDAGADRGLILKTIERCTASAKQTPRSLRYFDGAVREAIAANQSKSSEASSLMDRILAGRKAA